MLPEVFRHKTTKIRVPLPRAILLDFHGTISERRWEDKVIYPYVKQAVGGYLENNWFQDNVQKCLPGLRNESFEQRFRNKFEDAPVIHDGQDDSMEPKELVRQVGEFIVWQINSRKATHETQVIERLVWQDGLASKRILTPIFDDVMPCVAEWHTKYQCGIYVISSLEYGTLKLLFENTNKGNLDQYVIDYVSTKSGDKLVSDVYRKFHDSLHLQDVKTGVPKDAGRHRSGLAIKHSSPHADRIPKTSSSSPHQLSGSKSRESLPTIGRSSSPRSNSSFEQTVKPILFLTDSGQEAKAASQVNNGRAFDCILLNRPGNKKIRTYYLSQFQYIERFDDIEFVT